MTTRSAARQGRHRRLRSRIEGTPERPRLSVFRSNAHTYAQVIDDTRGHTLVSASTLESDVAGDDATGKTGQAEQVGRRLAERATQAGVAKVVFDRGGFTFQGRVQAVAEGAREGGLEF